MSGEKDPKQQQGCPVDHGKAQQTSSSWSPRNWFSSSSKPPTNTELRHEPQSTAAAASGGCPVKHSQTDGCPVKHDGLPFMVPASVEESARHPQSPHPDQRTPLSTHRVVSSIPRADELREEKTIAPHQPEEEPKWVYPSEQQFYNAMRRKGWEGIDEATVPFVVRIHNAVNERGWNDVRRWERELHNNPNPRLVRFLGRPKDMSPRAFLNTYMFWYNAPFDRHDWFIDRGDDKPPRRYVIDFYNGNDGISTGDGIVSSVLNRVRGVQPEEQPPVEESPAGPPSMYMDVRPALDSPEAFSDRFKMFFMDGFPGIYAAFKQSSSPPALAAQAPPANNTEEKASK